jgi:hypothetical protein
MCELAGNLDGCTPLHTAVCVRRENSEAVAGMLLKQGWYQTGPDWYRCAVLRVTCGTGHQLKVKRVLLRLQVLLVMC